MPGDEFDIWNIQKKALHLEKRIEGVYFDEREIWWVSLGKNLGFEQDGKGEHFRRPVLIIKKFNQYVFLGIPLTSKNKENKYYIPIDIGDTEKRSVIISQIRLIDSCRLTSKMGVLSKEEFQKIKNTIRVWFE